MKTLRASVVFAFLLACLQAFGGTERPSAELPPTELNPRSFELAVESGYLFGAINPPTDYQIGAEFLTARVRWGVVRSDTWLRGYHQFYVSAIAEPIFRGIENHYFGFNLGMRYNFVLSVSGPVPYITGAVGPGGIPRRPGRPGGQG